jgi:hypothetical protein
MRDHQHQVQTQGHVVGKSCRPRNAPTTEEKSGEESGPTGGGWAARREAERLIVR